MEDELGKRYEIKTTVIGGEEGDERRVRVLNRLITWVPGTGVQYEADPRHAQVLHSVFKILLGSFKPDTSVISQWLLSATIVRSTC